MGKGTDIRNDYYGPFGENHGLSFLDLNARWHTIEHNEEEVIDRFKYVSVAMDGGLVCQLLDADKEDEVVLMFVSNPIAKTSRRLPFAPGTSAWNSSVNIVVDNIADNYKIFLISVGDEEDFFTPIVVYDSITNQWRSTAKLPKGPFEDGFCVRKNAVFDGLPYLLALCEGAKEHWLWSYNHVEDA